MAELIRTVTLTIATTGGAGVSAGNAATLPLNGWLLDIYLDYNASAPAGTDVTVSESVFGTIMTRTDSATDGRFAPRMPVHNQTAGAITNGYDRFPLSDSVITVAVAQCNDFTTALTATIRYVTVV